MSQLRHGDTFFDGNKMTTLWYILLCTKIILAVGSSYKFFGNRNNAALI